MVTQMTAQGERSVAVGTVINSVINTGDHNRFFIGDYERLRDAYVEPWQVFERVNLARFVGREWLLAEVDAFLRDHDRGYFVLEAEAGLGKTTFLAWLVKERGYVHHFVELARGQEGVGTGLKNLGAQLVLNYHLEAWEAEGVLPGAAVRPDYLARLLKLAAEARPAGGQVVLVVDALDEAGTPMGQNVLGLPQVLPEGVYVIASQRPVAVALQVDTASTRRRVFRLAAESAGNQLDMRRYLEGAATWPGIATALRDSGYSTEQFVETLMAKCSGVWIYLHYVIHEIERGERTPLDLDGLPDGMTQYYSQYWQRWRGEDEVVWYQMYLPLLSMLAAAREAVSVERLVTWTDVTQDVRRLKRLMNERWRPFLALSEVDGKTRYRFYHATLTEFFSGQVDREKLSLAELEMVDELAEAVRTAHGRLADLYLEAWGGLAQELPGLDDDKRDLDGGYGLRQLAAHLAGVGRWEELHVLVAEGKGDHQPWAEARLLAEGSYAEYLADVQRAWQETRRCVQQAETDEEQEAALARCIRYALIVTSINSLAGNYEPALIGRAVETGLWTAAQALGVAARVVDDEKRVSMYAAILSADGLTTEEQREAAEGGLVAAQAIEDDVSRARALAAVQVIYEEDLRARASAALPQLMGELLTQRLAAAQAIGDEESRADALAALVPKLTGKVRDEALAEGLAAAQATEDPGSRAFALATLALHLSGQLREQALTQGLAAAQDIETDWFRANALAVLTPQLSGEQLAQVLAVAQAIKDEKSRAHALATLALQLPGELQALGLAAVQAIKDEESLAHALAALAPQLTGELREEALADGLAAAQAIEDDWSRAHALAALAPQLTGELREEALVEGLAAAQAIEHDWSRAHALAALAPRLTGEPREESLRQGVVAARAIWNKAYRADALAMLGLHLSGELREEALTEGLAAAQAIEDDWSRAYALAALVPQLTGELRDEALAHVMAAAQAIEEEDDRAYALAALVPTVNDVTYEKTRRRQAREALENHLSNNLQEQDRSAVFRLCSDKFIFVAPIVREKTLDRVSSAIVDVGRWWP